jgi:hypothetical protein
MRERVALIIGTLLVLAVVLLGLVALLNRVARDLCC